MISPLPLLPLAKLALASGLKLPELQEQLKAALIEAASDQASNGKRAKPSVSQLSVTTGVHRKDVRRLLLSDAQKPVIKSSLASQVFSLWLSDPLYLTKQGEPRVLLRTSSKEADISFERLVKTISTDVHPRSVQEELERLGLLQVQKSDRVKLIAKAFAPQKDCQALWALSMQNANDHLEACFHNLSGNTPVFLEQALYSDELSEASATLFNRATAAAWKMAFDYMMQELRALAAQDLANNRKASHRVAFGLYSRIHETT